MKNKPPAPRPYKLGIIGASGKLGYATLTSLLTYSLIPSAQIVATTTAIGASAPQVKKLTAWGVEVRHCTFDDGHSIERALMDVEAVLLVSSPRIERDFGDVRKYQGRERDHITAIEAARRAGVSHVYYTSLGFGRPSKSAVMRAHIVTEEFLEENEEDIGYTILREGLYSESWPLYLGHWDLGKDDRQIVTVAGDGRISWTAIEDLGLATALVLSQPREQCSGKIIHLSNTRDPMTLHEVAALVGSGLGKRLTLAVAYRTEHEEFYIKQQHLDEGHVKWWSQTYEALRDGECDIQDDTLESLLATKGRFPKPFAVTVQEMLHGRP